MEFELDGWMRCRTIKKSSFRSRIRKENLLNSGSSYETSPVLTSVGAASRRDIRLRSRLESALTRKKFHFHLNRSTTSGFDEFCILFVKNSINRMAPKAIRTTVCPSHSRADPFQWDSCPAAVQGPDSVVTAFHFPRTCIGSRPHRHK